MKGIILAGGTGSRLHPLTKVTNKHLLPIYKYPMIYYPLNTLAKAGIDDIMIISSDNHTGHFLDLLGSGEEFNVKLSYGVQKEALGVADALSLCEDFAGNDKITVILGDNIFEDDITEAVLEFEKQKNGAKVFLKEVEDANRFGVAEINEGYIVNVEEKPKNPKTNLAVAGLYMYDNNVFNFVKKLSLSERGELEITDVNNFYIKEKLMNFSLLKGAWTDAGTFESLFEANKIARDIFLNKN